MKERSDEERGLFYRDRKFVLDALEEIQDFELGSQDRQNAIGALNDTLDVCREDGNLVNICSYLARITLEKGEVKLGPGKDAEKRKVTLEDISILQATIRDRLRATPRNSNDPATVTLRIAMSRLNSVQLFFCAIYAEKPFHYWEKTLDHNGFAVSVPKIRYFGGIPGDKLPQGVRPVKKGNLTELVSIIDLGTHPANAEKIYNILLGLEKNDPIVSLAVEPGGVILERRVSRAGEAKFFLDHLPKGLKPWAATES